MKSKMSLLLAAVMTISVAFLSSCNKLEEEDFDVCTIENFSGYTWYKTLVYVSDTEKGEYEIAHDGFVTVQVGQTIRVKTDCKYFAISAKTSTGNRIDSRRIKFNNNKGVVTLKDLF